jgi:hypothetical protein
MTIPRIEDFISSLITPELSEKIRGHLAAADAIVAGEAKASEFHSLQSWPSGASRYHLVYNDVSAVLFRDGVLFGVAKFDRKLLSKKNPAKRFRLPLPSGVAEGGL